MGWAAQSQAAETQCSADSCESLPTVSATGSHLPLTTNRGQRDAPRPSVDSRLHMPTAQPCQHSRATRAAFGSTLGTASSGSKGCSPRQAALLGQEALLLWKLHSLESSPCRKERQRQHSRSRATQQSQWHSQAVARLPADKLLNNFPNSPQPSSALDPRGNKPPPGHCKPVLRSGPHRHLLPLHSLTEFQRLSVR